MPVINTVLKSAENGQLYRILWLSDANETVCLFNLDTQGMPVLIKYSDLLAQIRDGVFAIEDNDPYMLLVDEEELTDKERQIRDKIWAVTEAIIFNEPTIYMKNERCKILFDIESRTKITVKTLYNYLKKYWLYGKTKNAFIPQHRKQGGFGKERLANADTQKRGRPKKRVEDKGINVTKEIQEIFEKAYKRFFHTRDEFSFKTAYTFMVREWFSYPVINEDGSVSLKIKPETPTIGQFRYWYSKKHDVIEKTTKRKGESKFALNHRAILGKSDYGVQGSGAQYQIDATVGDIYLVSQFNPAHIIGRPVIYLVVDVFSRLVVGLYIGLESPSWAGDMMALANAASDKVKFCAEHEIIITEAEWPAHHIPAVIIGDRGELESKAASTLTASLGVSIINKPAYRADLKGIVEQLFHTINEKTMTYLPGHVKPDMRERGGKDYRLDAKLTIRELTHIIIMAVLHYNNTHYLSGYNRTVDMIKDDVIPIPVKLWAWGIANISRGLKSFPEEFVKLCLMPTDTATVTEKDIRYKGMYYTCGRAMAEHWFERARQSKSYHVEIAFDRRDMAVVYIKNIDGTAEKCWLLSHNAMYAQKCLDEILYLREVENAQRQNYERTEIEAEVNYISSIEKIVANAEERARKAIIPDSKVKRVGEIRENRHLEKAINRTTEKFNLGTDEQQENELEPKDTEDNDVSSKNILALLTRHLEENHG